MAAFAYQEMFPLGEDNTPYRRISGIGDGHFSIESFQGKELIKIASEGLSFLAETAFRDVSHLLRPAHLQQLADIVSDPESSDNDRYVALEFLKNAVIAAEGEFPLCQDTGTAIVMGKKGHRIRTDFNDEAALSEGIYRAYTNNNLRYSQNAPLSLYDEKNTGCNLPAQIDLYATRGNAYDFLFIAKGGGSANKTYLFQETKAVLTPERLADFLTDKMRGIGTAACPPYHLGIAIGGTSVEMNLKTVKLATAGYLDMLPTSGNEHGHAFRDPAMEIELLDRSRALGIGAQFGGKHFCLNVRVIRLPRHGASCPIGMGVSCSAHRNIKAKIDKKGIFLEALETGPAKYLDQLPADREKKTDVVSIDLNRSMDDIRSILSKYPVATRLSLSGKIVVARDIAHAKLKTHLDRGEPLPQYLRDHMIYYAGPAKTPKGYASGSFGPTTAGRMDPYVPLFQEHGASLVMLAKGNRSEAVTRSCQTHGGFYLGSIGGPAARLGKECITGVEILEYPELGMEAVFMITVKNFPAFIIVDDKGNDFFAPLIG